LSYDHFGNENDPDSFSIIVDDGALSDGPETVDIRVTNVNDPPKVTLNAGITISEGDVDAVIDSTVLNTTDSDTDADKLVYTVLVAPAHGLLQVAQTTLGVNGHFTQEDIDNGLVNYDHDGTEDSTDEFTFEVQDAQPLTDGPLPFTITILPVNDAPTISTNTGFAVDEGGATTIEKVMLESTDSDNAPNELTYVLTTDAEYGWVRLDGVDLYENDTFTQDDVDSGLVTYAHQGTEEPSDSFEVTVQDLEPLTEGPVVVNVTVNPQNDAPEITTHTGFAVDEGSETTIDTALLEATDSDNMPSELTYVLTTDAEYGLIRLDGVDLYENDTFTQSDVDSGLVTYAHQGTEEPTDSFEVTVQDLEPLTDGPVVMNVTINAVNDAPVIVTHTGFAVDEGSETTIDTSMLEATDSDNTASELTYVLTSGAMHGSVRLDGADLYENETFTQDDVDSGLVTYAHQG
ncbi:MAG: hypothetical protein HN348_33370, partial [Proteobacteria bacterium]|nr:hypothetical protein [Pseudomonadota bacterium]